MHDITQRKIAHDLLEQLASTLIHSASLIAMFRWHTEKPLIDEMARREVEPKPDNLPWEKIKRKFAHKK